MANTSNKSKDTDPNADDQPTSFLEVYSQARDTTEKLDLLAFAVNELGDSKLTRAAKDFRDNQLRILEPGDVEPEPGSAEAAAATGPDMEEAAERETAKA
jgi:hypothetical protein